MKYEIRLPATTGEVVPLCEVCSTKAQVRATAGGTPFHRPTYDGSLKAYVSDLLQEARSGSLQVCNQWGSTGRVEDLIASAERNGTLVRHVRYLVEPDMDRLRRENEPIAPGVWHFGRPNLGPEEIDLEPTHIGALYATLKALNEWGASRGDEFTVTHEGIEWIDERGVVRPTGREAAPEAASDAGATASVAAESSLAVRVNDNLQAVSKSQDEVTGDDRPGLETRAVVHAFAGIRWDVKQWSDALNKTRPQWLMKHRLRLGWQGNGGKQAEWCPLGIAESLFKADGRAKPVSLGELHRVFTTKPDLKPWRDKWTALKLDLAVLAEDDTGQQR